MTNHVNTFTTVLAEQETANTIARIAVNEADLTIRVQSAFAGVTCMAATQRVAEELTLVQANAQALVRDAMVTALNRDISTLHDTVDFEGCDMSTETHLEEQEQWLKGCWAARLKLADKAVLNRVGYIRRKFNARLNSTTRIVSVKQGKQWVFVALEGSQAGQKAKAEKTRSKDQTARSGQSSDTVPSIAGKGATVPTTCIVDDFVSWVAEQDMPKATADYAMQQLARISAIADKKVAK